MAKQFCSNCGNKIPDNARFCNSCGQRVNETVSSPQVQPIPPPQGPSIITSPAPVVQKSNRVLKNVITQTKLTLSQRIRWLFTANGLPVLITILIGFVIGAFINGAIGLILSTAAGLFVLYLFKRLPFKLKPWQELVTGISPIVARLLFFMIFLLPVASYLSLPTGQTPNTLMKYVSIVILLPKNLFSMPRSDVFPGLVILVLISIGLMLYGSMNLSKLKGWIFALFGLLLYTLSPTITSVLMGNVSFRFIPSFFNVGYYFAWLGLILLPLSKFFPRWLKIAPGAKAVLNIVPPVLLFPLITQDETIRLVDNSVWLTLFEFENDHHFIAGIFSGGLAAWGAGSVVGEAGASGNEAPEDPEKTEAPEDSGDSSEEPVPSGPQPYDNPDAPPGSTIEYNADGSKTIRCPDGTVATKYKDGTEEIHMPDGSTGFRYPDGTEVVKLPDGTTATTYSDGTVYGEYPDGSKTTEYPDGTTKSWSPDGTSQTTNPDGSFEVTYPDGTSASLVKNPDGSMDATSYNGDTIHFPKDGPPVGTITKRDGTSFTFNPDGTGSVTVGPPYQGTLDMDKDGNLSGTVTDDQGNVITMNPDGSMEAKTKEGDTVTVDASGLKVKLKDGTSVTTDPEGNITGAHIKDEKGTIDMTTDPNGNTHIQDDKGNTIDINPDGSGTMGGEYKGTWDTKGNSEFTGKDGSKMTSGSDGSVSIQDGQGNKADLDKNGSLTIKDNTGKTTTFTPEQVKQMSGQ